MSATTLHSAAPSHPAVPAVARKAVLHRMVMSHHTCPYGLKAKDLLQRSGYEVEDHHLTTRMRQTTACRGAPPSDVASRTETPSAGSGAPLPPAPGGQRPAALFRWRWK